MYPYVVDWTVFGIHIHPPTYGVLLATAFSAGYFLSIWRALKLGEDPKEIENIFLWVVIASVLGSRLFHVCFEEPAYYWNHPAKIVAIWEGGYTFYGALLASMLAIFIYVRWKKLDFLQIGDIAAPGTALGLAIGRVGCYAAGCCWGRQTKVRWAVVFSRPDSFCDLRNVPLHPTQLYEAVGALLLFFYLQWRFTRRRYAGQILFEGLLIYSILRYVIEFYRGDEYRGYIIQNWVSYSQGVSILILPFAIGGIVWHMRRKHD
jgi:phosphatidylglycerol:prolipoprotein diacylglycerol transferase